MNTRYGFPAWVAETIRCAILGLTSITGQVSAEGDIDQDQALELRQAGEILPLERVLVQAGQRVRRGHLIKAELEREDERLIYELEYLDGGQVREFYFDATTGEFLGAGRD